MFRILLLLISIVALISLLFNIHFILEKQSARYRVVEVIDGDTFKIDFEGGKRVRLLGIDAPETGRCLSGESKIKLEQLVSGKEVKLTDQFSDPYGRIMANVFVGEVYVNREMLAAGMGKMDYGENPRKDELKAAYMQATIAKLGVHGNQCLKMTSGDASCRIKGNLDENTNRRFYYLPECKGYANVTVNTAYGDSWFCSENEASAAGFVKSATCP